MMRLEWSPRAADDLVRIVRFISSDSPKAARRFGAKLKSAAESVVEYPWKGRVVPELVRPEVREIIHGNYRVVYLVQRERLVILTLFEGHQEFPPLQSDLG